MYLLSKHSHVFLLGARGAECFNNLRSDWGAHRFGWDYKDVGLLWGWTGFVRKKNPQPSPQRE